MNQATLIGMLAETPVHPGSGQTTSVLDLPVARERTTDYPVIAGSSLKGALRDYARTVSNSSATDIDTWFGRQESGGRLLVSDARLLLLPVRSLDSAFRWITCPYALERFKRDSRLTGRDVVPDIPRPASDDDARGSAEHGGPVFLEEREVRCMHNINNTLIEALRPLIAHDDTAALLAERLVIVPDATFQWFARHGLPVSAHNALDEQTKASTQLWHEETLPPDTLMYTVLAERPQANTANVHKFIGNLTRTGYLQVGANETVGQGWFALSRYDGTEARQ